MLNQRRRSINLNWTYNLRVSPSPSLSIVSSSIVVVRSDPPELQFNGVKVISQEQGHNTEDGDGRLPPGPRCPQRHLGDLRRPRGHRPEPGPRRARGGGLDRLQGRRHSRFLLLHKVQTENVAVTY